MYSYFNGKIVEINDEETIIDVHDIGYSFLHLRKDDFKIGQTCKVLLYHVVREDDEFLVGFKTNEDRNIFEKLISVKGIGPRTAVNALSAVTSEQFIEAITAKDIKFLKKLPGIGPKAAQQIILDLNGKLVINNLETKWNKNQELAISGLHALGFKTKECEDVISRLPETLEVEELIRESLRRLKK